MMYMTKLRTIVLSYNLITQVKVKRTLNFPVDNLPERDVDSITAIVFGTEGSDLYSEPNSCLDLLLNLILDKFGVGPFAVKRRYLFQTFTTYSTDTTL